MIIDCHYHAGTGDGLIGPWDPRAPLQGYRRRAMAAGIQRTVLLDCWPWNETRILGSCCRSSASNSPREISIPPSSVDPFVSAGRRFHGNLSKSVQLAPHPENERKAACFRRTAPRLAPPAPSIPVRVSGDARPGHGRDRAPPLPKWRHGPRSPQPKNAGSSPPSDDLDRSTPHRR